MPLRILSPKMPAQAVTSFRHRQADKPDVGTEDQTRQIDIVDSVVAEDIAKLPDFNVADALQRITGIQILRDRGEGA